MTWESEYPHSDSNWPNDRKVAEQAFLNVPDDEVHAMVELNAARLFNLEAEKRSSDDRARGSRA